MLRSSVAGLVLSGVAITAIALPITEFNVDLWGAGS